MARFVMKPWTSTAATIVLTAISTIYGQTPPASTGAKPAPKPASAGLINDWLRTQSPSFQAWDLGAQIRVRYESFDNGGVASGTDFQGAGAKNDNAFLLLREKVHIGYKSTWIGGFVEGRDATSNGDRNPARPGSDSFDLYQAYVTLGNAKNFPVTAKVGRQELIYGDERLVGASDWTNPSRVFDAAKLRYEDQNFWIDAFSGRVVLNDDHNFNVVDDYDWLSGLYASTTTLIPKQETQLYVLARNSSKGAAVTPRDIYTFGARVKSLPGQFKGWDYAGELAGQEGSMNIGGKRLEHEALATSAGGGYTWTKSFGSPRVGLEYNYASGSDDPTKSGTFENLFPTNHKHYGTMDFVGWRNIHNPRASFSIKPLDKLTLSADYHLFFLATTKDSFYPQSGAGRAAGGYGKNAGFSNFVGSELDLEANYIVTKWATVRAGYGHFFAGEYIKQSKAAVGGAVDADWFYVQTTFNF